MEITYITRKNAYKGCMYKVMQGYFVDLPNVDITKRGR